MPLPRCRHSIPPTLAANLGDSPNICPSCTMENTMASIHECQVGIARRGGIFKSKERIREERKAGGKSPNQQFKRHRAWLRKWRSAKATAWRDIEKFEQILKELELASESPETQQAEDMVRLALAKWEEQVDRLTVTPGVRCIEAKEASDSDSDGTDDMDDTEDEDMELTKATALTIADEKSALSATVPYHFPMPLENDYRHSDKSKESAPDRPLSPDCCGTVLDSTSPENIPLPQSEDTDLVEENTTGYSLLAGTLDSRTTPSNRRESVLQTPLCLSAEYKYPLRTSSLRRTYQTPAPPSTPSTPSRFISHRRTSTPRSFLKFPRFAETASIAIDAADESPPATTEQPHNPHTNAEQSRHANNFNRTKPTYQPGEWSSPAGFRKVDTSSPGQETRWHDEDMRDFGDKDKDSQKVEITSRKMEDKKEVIDDDDEEDGDEEQADDSEAEDENENYAATLRDVEARIHNLTLRLITLTRG